MIINDLSSHKELDSEAMTQLRGGFLFNRRYLRRTPPQPGPRLPGPTFPVPTPRPKPRPWPVLW